MTSSGHAYLYRRMASSMAFDGRCIRLYAPCGESTGQKNHWVYSDDKNRN